MDDEQQSQLYEDFPKDVEERVLQFIGVGKSITAIQELKIRTGWSLSKAKGWVDEIGIPLALQRPDLAPPKEETPCPFCGLPLRTPRAQQCRHCKRDWH